MITWTHWPQMQGQRISSGKWKSAGRTCQDNWGYTTVLLPISDTWLLWIDLLCRTWCHSEQTLVDPVGWKVESISAPTDGSKHKANEDLGDNHCLFPWPTLTIAAHKTWTLIYICLDHYPYEFTCFRHPTLTDSCHTSQTCKCSRSINPSSLLIPLPVPTTLPQHTITPLLQHIDHIQCIHTIVASPAHHPTHPPPIKQSRGWRWPRLPCPIPPWDTCGCTPNIAIPVGGYCTWIHAPQHRWDDPLPLHQWSWPTNYQQGLEEALVTHCTCWSQVYITSGLSVSGGSNYSSRSGMPALITNGYPSPASPAESLKKLSQRPSECELSYNSHSLSSPSPSIGVVSINGLGIGGSMDDLPAAVFNFTNTSMLPILAKVGFDIDKHKAL